MEKENIDLAVDDSRRKFLEKAGKVSVAAPAAALLLSAGVAQADTIYDCAPDEELVDIPGIGPTCTKT